MATFSRSDVRNHLLTSLSAEDFAALLPNLRLVEMPMREVLHAPGEPITRVYFPQTGFASLMAILENGDAAEVGLIGYEGVIGVPVVLGSDRSPVEAMVQCKGTAIAMDADAFRRALAGSEAMRALMLNTPWP